MRWVKGTDYIQIDSVASTDMGGEQLIVDSTVGWPHLPLEFKDQIAACDVRACKALHESVEVWARANGFTKDA